ncbi:MAG TPA: VWA domain-containing protein [Terriglobales bacterium]|nr:VWA domain-containing protein [Terriglobales bacterium]
MKTSIAAISILCLASIAALALWSGGQDREQQERPLRQEAAAIVKLVPVRVLGADGRPVMDLRKEDFALFEDGQKKTITEFEVHTITQAGMVVAPELPAAVKPSALMNRKFFLFLDVQGSDPEGRQKAIAVAERFLDSQVRPGDEVGLLGFHSMSGFFIKEYLTTDIARVRRALKGVTEIEPSQGEAYSIPEVTDEPIFIPGTIIFARSDFVDRLKDVAEVFKTIPGNKSLVLFTSRSLGPEVGRLFGATGTAVYAINTQDWWFLRTGDKVKHIWWEHPLKDMAAASGGSYFADINQVTDIARDLQELTGNFYVLGYYVKESWEGKYHRIRVEVGRPGTRVLVQEGYTDAKPFARMTDFEKALQLLDLIWSDEPASHPLPVAVDLLVPAAGPDQQACLLARLDVGARTGPPAAKSEIIALVRDKAGAEILSCRWVLDLGRYDGRTLFPYLIVGVPPGTYDARMAVRDLGSGEACAGRTRLEVAAPPHEGIVLFSPLLLEAGAEAEFVRLPSAQKGKDGGRERSLVDLYPMIPKACRPVISEIDAGTEKLTLVLPFELRPPRTEERPILSVEAKLFSPMDGVETPLRMTIRDRRTFEGNPDVLVAEIVFPVVQPGAYDLEIAIQDMDSGRRGSVRKPLVFR